MELDNLLEEIDGQVRELFAEGVVIDEEVHAQLENCAQYGSSHEYKEFAFDVLNGTFNYEYSWFNGVGTRIAQINRMMDRIKVFYAAPAVNTPENTHLNGASTTGGFLSRLMERSEPNRDIAELSPAPEKAILHDGFQSQRAYLAREERLKVIDDSLKDAYGALEKRLTRMKAVITILQGVAVKVHQSGDDKPCYSDELIPVYEEAVSILDDHLERMEALWDNRIVNSAECDDPSHIDGADPDDEKNLRELDRMVSQLLLEDLEKAP